MIQDERWKREIDKVSEEFDQKMKYHEECLIKFKKQKQESIDELKKYESLGLTVDDFHNLSGDCFDEKKGKLEKIQKLLEVEL